MRALALVVVAACSVETGSDALPVVTPSCAVGTLRGERDVLALMMVTCEPGHRAVIDLDVAALRPFGFSTFGHVRQYVECGTILGQMFPFPEWVTDPEPELLISGLLRDPPGTAPVTCETPTPLAEKTNGAR